MIVPATLRKQWQQELIEKFFLPSVVLESANYRKRKQEGARNPFDRTEQIVICSYQFAAAKKDEVSGVKWDLAVIDEAHRLRNVYKPGAKISTALKESLQNIPKLLLTATPLQNSLMELYGLVGFIDENVFGESVCSTAYSARWSQVWISRNGSQRYIRPIIRKSSMNEQEIYQNEN